jgi:hypothetical protein
MNTPAHLAVSLLVWQQENRWRNAVSVAIGAVLPDLPMFGFYAYQKLIGSSERRIWSELYFTHHWQYVFDIFNSLPLALALFFVFRIWDLRWAQLLVASAALHMLCDLPVHHDDGHRHFLPISNFRFESPISYWDPNHFGMVFIWIELLVAIGSCVYVFRHGARPMMRLAMLDLALYGLAVMAGLAFLTVRFFQ